VTANAYCTLENVRTWGITTSQANDQVVLDRIDIASAIVDDYCGLSGYGLGGTFAAQKTTTITVGDVRLPMVPLPRPFTNVTALTIDGRTLDATTFIVENWGIRLYIAGYLDVDGFPRRSSTSMGYGGPGYGWPGMGAPYGSQVAVTATFGYTSVPLPVRHATVLIAAFLVFGQGETLLDPRVSTVAVEGYTLRYPTRGGPDTELIATTGVIEADRLLAPYAGATINVA
jgi:hypothetical protein